MFQIGIRVVVEMPKSLCTSRPKKDKQAMAPVHVSTWNQLRSKNVNGGKGESRHYRNKQRRSSFVEAYHRKIRI